MSLTSLLIALAFVVGTVAFALGIQAIVRRLATKRMSEDTQRLADAMVFRIGALHGLILALVFAQELLEYHGLQAVLSEEAAAVGDVYWDIERYGGPVTDPVQAAMASYARMVVEAEWEALGTRRVLLDEAWGEREIAYTAVLALEPQTPREQALRAHMLTALQKISALRIKRESAALTKLNPLFWVAAFAGLAVLVGLYFGYAGTLLNQTLFGVFAAYTGLILFVIYAFSNPFSDPGALSPLQFERLLEGAMGHRGYGAEGG